MSSTHDPQQTVPCRCDFNGGPVRCPRHTPPEDFGPVTAGQADRIIELLETLVLRVREYPR